MKMKTTARKDCPDKINFGTLTLKNIPAVALVIFLSLIALKIIFGGKKKTRDPKGLAVFVTGCDHGVGYECAKKLDRLGFHVFAGCHFPEGEGALRLKSRTSDKLTIVGIDVANDEEVQKAAEFVRQRLPREAEGLYALINNAGQKLYGDFDWYTMTQCEKQVNVTLLGTIRVTKYFLPLLKPSKGRIITFTGINGRIAFPQLSIYSATKFALEGFCRSLRYEMEKFKIAVSVIQPGDLSLSFSLLQSYKQNAEEMWESMSPENRDYYKSYFEWCKEQVRAASRTEKRTHKDTFKLLLQDLEHAVTSPQPKMRYISAPFPFKNIYTILGVLPESWRIAIIHFYMRRKTDKKVRQELEGGPQRKRAATVSW